jgi:pyruvate kinase
VGNDNTGLPVQQASLERASVDTITDALTDRLLPRLYRVREDALNAEQAHADALSLLEEPQRSSGRNLLHYLAVRQHDIRDVQFDLMSIGLSSLGICESHTLASLNRVIAILEELKDRPRTERPNEPVDLNSGPLLLRENAAELLGPDEGQRAVKIMVTMPTEAATDPQLIEDLLRNGMNVMRINCAHDSPETWRAMAENLRTAEKRTGKRCLVQADLAGPKVRTGPIEPVGRILKIKPQRDAFGRTIRPGRVWLGPDAAQLPEDVDALLPISKSGCGKLKVGDELRCRDARGKKRALDIVERTDTGVVAEAEQTAYLITGLPLKVHRRGKKVGSIKVGMLPEVSEPILVDVGDELILTRDFEYGSAAPRDELYRATGPARLHCTLSEAFDRAASGQAVWFDDGKIGGVIRDITSGEMTIEITHAGADGARLRAEKGINFPETNLEIEALTAKDIRDLEEVVQYVDIVALSFVRRPEDVLALEDHLTRLDAQHIGVVLKIENKQAFELLPRILLAAMRSPPVGVMVARGDLAVEVGFQRMSEVQEEILWLGEAAHVPLIWATQVLEGLAKRGAPTRAEVTDASAGQRAECVMLNKGPHIVETTRFLRDVLSRMGAHHRKRRATLRKLSIAEF